MSQFETDLAQTETALGYIPGDVLRLWLAKSPDLPQIYKKFVTEPIKFRGARPPAGYVGKNARAVPVKRQQIALIVAYSKYFFEKRYSYQEIVDLLQTEGIILSRMGAKKALMRIGEELQLHSYVPKGRKVTIETLEDAEEVLKKQKKAYAKQAVKEKKSAEQIREDLNVKPKPEPKPEKKKEVDPEFAGREILYEPTKKQAIFHAASETIVLYGGAAGGGKSFALLFDAIRYGHVAGYKALIIRRTMPELTELIETSKEYYPKLFPGAKFNTQKTTWRLPSGALIIFGYLEKGNDKLRYQGQQYQYIAFDELGQWNDPEGWNYLKSRLRAPEGDKALIDPYTKEPIPLLMRATSNPGASWVKEMFIDAAPENTTFYDRAGVSHKFIPATLLDNPHLGEHYRKMLESLPEVERRQLLYGDWNATDSAAFPEFRPDGTTDVLPDGTIKEICDPHVIEPFFIPKHWNRVCGMDYGYRDPATAIWYAIDPATGQKIVYKEYHQSGRTGTEYAQDIKAMEMDEVIPIDHVIDWSVFNKTGYTGPTIGEQIRQAGIMIRPADKNRIGGKVQIHTNLRPMGDTTIPGVVFFSSCTGIIKQLQAAQIKENDPDDIDQTRIGEGHKHHWDLYDALRYGLMARPTVENRAMMFQRAKQESRWNRVERYFS